MEDIIDNIKKLDDSKINMLNTLISILGDTDLLTRIENSFGSYMNLPNYVLVQIYKNQKLFKICNLICQRLVLNLDQAVLMKKQDDILVHLGNIDIYAVMTPDEYKQFKRFSVKNDIYQIILLSEKQKIILLHDQDQDFVKELIDATKKTTKYELVVRNTKNQLEIKNKIVDNYNQVKEIHNELINALYRKYKDIGQMLKLIEPDINGYVSRVLKLLITKEDLGNYNDLGTVVVINNNYNTEIGTNHGLVNSGSGKGVQVVNKNKDLAKQWMENNLPEEPTSIKQMQERCKNDTGIDISNVTLGKILREVCPDIKSKKINGTGHYFV